MKAQMIRILSYQDVFFADVRCGVSSGGQRSSLGTRFQQNGGRWAATRTGLAPVLAVVSLNRGTPI